jgi:hypothetical protein
MNRRRAASVFFYYSAVNQFNFRFRKIQTQHRRPHIRKLALETFQRT